MPSNNTYIIVFTAFSTCPSLSVTRLGIIFPASTAWCRTSERHFFAHLSFWKLKRTDKPKCSHYQRRIVSIRTKVLLKWSSDKACETTVGTWDLRSRRKKKAKAVTSVNYRIPARFRPPNKLHRNEWFPSSSSSSTKPTIPGELGHTASVSSWAVA